MLIRPGPTTTSFQQVSTSLVDGFGFYVWSNAANWTNGIPSNGSIVDFDISAASNPGGYDDIANLSISTLNLTQGALAVANTLTIGDLVLPSNNNDYVIESDTYLGSPSALLTIDSITGNGAFIEAAGANAFTNVLATDTGNEYDVSGGGMIELHGSISSLSTLAMPSYILDSGTIALANPGAVVSAVLGDLVIGDVLELPGSTITSVQYGASSLTITTDDGTTTFSNVRYNLDDDLYGYTSSADTTTGLEAITLTGTTATSFEQTTASGGLYLWSNAANWSNGIPTDGEAVDFDISPASNPGGYDDIANLTLSVLNLTQGALAVANTLTVGDLVLPSDNSDYVIESDTYLGSPAARLIIGSITGNGAFIEAGGANAFTDVLGTDTGNEYDVAGGGMVELHGSISALTTLSMPSYSLDNGTIALASPGSVVSAVLGDLVIGDVLELPGSTVESVSYGTSSLTITTDAGTTTFTNVRYNDVDGLYSFTSSADTNTGLEAITLTGSTATSFQQVSPNGGLYDWSNSANWTNGIPGNGGVADISISTASNPGGYDDIANLTLGIVNLTQGAIAVANTLTIGDLVLPSDNNDYVIESDTYLGSPAARLIIDSITGNGAFIEAGGANAFTDVLGTDTGNEYDIAGGGMVELHGSISGLTTLAMPSYILDSGTIALADPGSLVSAVLGDLVIGDVLELPGSTVESVSYGTSSLTITTDAGTTTFSNVRYNDADGLYGYTSSADTGTGLEAITLTGSTATSFQQVSPNGGLYDWSNPANWTNGIPGNGGVADISISTAMNPGGYDDIANLTLGIVNLIQGAIAVADTLTIGDLVLPSNNNDYVIESDTYLGSPAARLIINSITGNGAFIEAGGTNAFTDILGTDTGNEYDVAGGGMVELHGTISSLTTLAMPSYSLDNGTIALASPGSVVSAVLGDLASGDVLELPGTKVDSVQYGASSLTITTDAGTTTFTNVRYTAGETLATYAAHHDAFTGLEAITLEVTCYAQGTRIATANGDIPVESLEIGDLVKTLHAGLQKIKWIGTRSYAAPFANHAKILPICIKSGALDDNIPARDLYVSPGHAICIDGVLIHAARLVNGVSITQAERIGQIVYYHIELENHEIIFAENTPAESFMGEYFRAQFHNAASYRALYPHGQAPEHMCLPRLDAGFQLDAIQRRLAARAGITPPSTTGPLRGYIDQAGPHICTGWAQDRAAPETPVCLDIYAQNTRIGRVLANLYRADVRAAGYGSGNHGFEYLLPPGTTGPIDIRRSLDGTSLAYAAATVALYG